MKTRVSRCTTGSVRSPGKRNWKVETDVFTLVYMSFGHAIRAANWMNDIAPGRIPALGLVSVQRKVVYGNGAWW